MSDKVEPRGEPLPEGVPEDVGSAPTTPGQTEVVAGTPEHERVLTSFPNASSYGPDVNVVLPPEPEPEPEPPPVMQDEEEEPNPLLTDDQRGDEPGRE